jgi:hypothetical protein
MESVICFVTVLLLAGICLTGVIWLFHGVGFKKKALGFVTILFALAAAYLSFLFYVAYAYSQH